MRCTVWVAVVGLTLALGSACSSSKRPNSAGTAGGSAVGGGAGAAGLTGASGAAGGSGSGGNLQSCATPGATRNCCTGGTQTCNGVGEFAVWGQCMGGDGNAMNCNPMGSGGCGKGEFGPNCDAGVDGGHSCATGEFGPNCGGPKPKLCDDSTISNEPEILAGYSPAAGQSVPQNGQIKVWVNDEHASIIAPGEQIDPNTGAITMPGDRTAKANDGYLWEPALYIAPQTAESGGTPHFPQHIKGWYNNVPPPNGGRPPRGAGVQVAGMDSPPAGVKLPEQYSTEDIWDVSSLGLKPGTYIAEFVIHDGDRDRAVGCVTIVITP